MKTILSIDLGTYCDNTLLTTILQPFFKTHKTIILADKSHEIPQQPNIKTYRYNTPRFFLEDANMELADPHQSVIFWALTNPTKAYEAAKWSSTMRKQLLFILQKHKDIKDIIVLYPAFPILIQVPLHILKQYNIHIIYYAPGFPNKSLPWVFDSTFRDPKFKIYKTSPEHPKSTLKYFSRIALFSKQTTATVIEKFALMNHITAFDLPHLIPSMNLSNIKFYSIGPIIPIQTLSPLPKLIQCISNTHRLIFLTFGSYATSPIVKQNITYLLNHLTNFIEQSKSKAYHIIYHNGDYSNKHITSLKAHIPYDALMSLIDLVIFTGSVCLQNICLNHRKPMLYVPVLSEQYFWAKNYTYHTKIPYYDLSNPTPPNIFKAMNSPRVKTYLSTVSKRLHTNTASSKLVKIINNHNQL